jgi:hypothetical protein
MLNFVTYLFSIKTHENITGQRTIVSRTQEGFGVLSFKIAHTKMLLYSQYSAAEERGEESGVVVRDRTSNGPWDKYFLALKVPRQYSLILLTEMCLGEGKAVGVRMWALLRAEERN